MPTRVSLLPNVPTVPVQYKHKTLVASEMTPIDRCNNIISMAIPMRLFEPLCESAARDYTV